MMIGFLVDFLIAAGIAGLCKRRSMANEQGHIMISLEVKETVNTQGSAGAPSQPAASARGKQRSIDFTKVFPREEKRRLMR